MNRSKKENEEILFYFGKCRAAFNAGLYFSADEYVCNIFNSFFKKIIYNYEKDLLEALENISNSVGNCRNAKTISFLRKELGLKELLKAQSENEYLFEDFNVLITQSKRFEIIRLNNIYDNKYCRDFEENFIRNSIIFNLIDHAIGRKTNSQSRVLDIGSGFGFLPYCFKRNNYIVDTIDMNNVPNEYKESIKILDLPYSEYKVEKQTPMSLKFPYKFDLITATQIVFNEHQTKKLWSIEDWKYFLFDLYDNFLTENSYVYLLFNYENIEINGKVYQLGSPELESFFEPYLDKNFSWKVAKFKKKDIKHIKDQ